MIFWSFLLIVPACAASPLSFGSSGPDPENSCSGRACNPRMGNLALGRVLSTRSVCGSNFSEPFCSYKQAASPRLGAGGCPAAKCSKCNSAVTGQAHPPSAMSDSSFRHPDTWWQSAEGVEEEELRLDLEAEFLFTHLIVVFRSPRPAAMVLERSQDRGRTWETLRHFARDCPATFGLAEGSACTSKYSGAFPCSGGEVIYRALPPSNQLDPFGAAAQHQLMVTNLRVRLLQRQPCPCQARQPGTAALPTRHYAIYDFILEGGCLCHGHAEQCVPARASQGRLERSPGMIHGKCVCRHNTAGEHCERCAPLYNEQPWQPANGISGTPRQCRRCRCNGRARSCHFSRGLWLATGRRSGGVCDDCGHNTQGRHCQSCKRGFFRGPAPRGAPPGSCAPCSCHPLGSVLTGSSPLCDPRSGECPCKPGVGGARCDRCMLGYWGLHEYGCRPCGCAGGCDPYTGDCVSGSDAGVFHAAAGQARLRGNASDDGLLFRAEELFSALHHSEKCECAEANLGSPKLFCAAEYDYVLVVKVMSAHDKGSHAEVEVQVKKVLFQKPGMKMRRGSITLYPESWTQQGCTCPILHPASEYVVAGHQDWKTGRPLVNTKSLVKPWRSSLGRKFLHILRQDCGHRWGKGHHGGWK